MYVVDNVEIEQPFLPHNEVYDLSPDTISLRDRHFYFVGRYLAQLHCSGMLMRDISNDNIMFRMSDGYPVLIDDPIPNYWGDKPSVYCRDLFVPAISFPKPRFEAFCLGYFENMQRLYAGQSDDITEEIIHCMGGDFVSVPNFHHPIEIVRFLHCVLGRGENAESARISPRHLVWSLIILQLHGLSAQFLKNALKRSPEKNALLQTELDFSDRVFLRMTKEAEWSREHLLLDRHTKICRDRETPPSDELNIASNAALTSYMELFGERPTDEWSDEFVTFWIQFLSGLGCYFDQKNPVLSIQTTQTAHVIFQHVNLAFLEKYRILHFLRCSDARRSWYWSTAEDSMQNFVHCIAYRNTESLSTSRVLGEFKKTNLLQERVPIHLIFDLIECDRNLMGNIIKFWSNAGSKDKDMASGLISCIAPSIIHRLGRTAFQLVQFLEDKKDTCFHFGWRFHTAKENIDELITDSAGGTVHDQLPVGMREIAWTTEVITRIVEGRQFDLDTFSREFAWVGEVWGGGWHSPFDRLGERGFRAVVFRNSEGNGKHIVMRAGCGMIVFGTIAGPDGRIEAQMQELLWPIPNEKGKTHYGEYAKA